MDEEMLDFTETEEEEVAESYETEEMESEQDEAEFTDTGEKEDEAADHSEASENDENADEAVEEAKTQKSSIQAEKRKQREAKEEAIRKKIETESYRKGIVDAVGGVNPFTGEAIKDDADIDEYLLMKKLEQQGKDPIEDYAAAVKGEKRELAEKEKADKTRREEVEEFTAKYPNVDISGLLQDPRFGKFAGKRVQHETLANVYADYLEFTADSSAEIERKAVVKAKTAEMKKMASPGSLAGSGDVPKLSYDTMSDKEFDKVFNQVMRGERKI